jgi:hypothetical protein
MQFYRAPLVSVFQVLAYVGLAAADNISLDVHASRNQVYLGESFNMQVAISGSESTSEPDLTGIKACTIRPLGSRSENRFSLSSVNGRMTRQHVVRRIFEYEIMPAQAGEFRAGPVSMKVGNQAYTHPGPAIRVQGIEDQDQVRITVQASREAVLVEEPFEITLLIFLRRLPSNLADADPIYPSNPPRLNADFFDQQAPEGLEGPNIGQLLQQRLATGRRPGFAINNYQTDPMSIPLFGLHDPFNRTAVFQLDRTAVTENGIHYFQYAFPLRYVPKKEGTYTFGPVVFKGPVAVGLDSHGQPLERQIFAVGPAVTVRVLPPPEEGRPSTFIGVIGSNLVVEASLDAQTCRVGDPLTMTLTLSGSANFEGVVPPVLGNQPSLTRHFKVYDDTVQARTLDGKRQFTYTIRPIAANTIELPPIEVAYYDTQKRRYEVARSTVLPLRVNETTQVGGEIVIEMSPGISPAAPLTQMQRGWVIAPLLYSPLGAVHTPLAPTTWHFALLLAPVLAIGSITLYRRGAPRIRQFLAGRHIRGACGRAIRELETARDSAAICRAVSFYLADRLNTTGSTLTPGDARAHIEKRLAFHEAGLPSAADTLLTAFEHHFNAQYAHGTSTADQPPVSDAALAEALINLDRLLENSR